MYDKEKKWLHHNSNLRYGGYWANGGIDEEVVLRAAFPFMLFIGVAMVFILTHIKLIIAG